MRVGVAFTGSMYQKSVTCGDAIRIFACDACAGEYGDEEENVENFDHHVGSGGGQGRTTDVLGGRGGGAIYINASTILVMDGRLTASGQPGMPGVDGSCDGVQFIVSWLRDTHSLPALAQVSGCTRSCVE